MCESVLVLRDQQPLEVKIDSLKNIEDKDHSLERSTDSPVLYQASRPPHRMLGSPHIPQHRSVFSDPRRTPPDPTPVLPAHQSSHQREVLSRNYYSTPPPPAHIGSSQRVHPTPGQEAPHSTPQTIPGMPPGSTSRGKVATPPHASQVPPQADSLHIMLQVSRFSHTVRICKNVT